jgi:hypothetical protein
MNVMPHATQPTSEVVVNKVRTFAVDMNPGVKSTDKASNAPADSRKARRTRLYALRGKELAPFAEADGTSIAAMPASEACNLVIAASRGLGE